MTEREVDGDDAEFQALKDGVEADIAALRREAELVYSELVLPHWGGADHHGLPRTLYGYVMSTFSFIDLLSRYRYAEAEQTRRMRRFLSDYIGASPQAAAAAVQLWRHTLMHTARPQTLVDDHSGRSYRWLLHWREHLPREQHMEFEEGSAHWILNLGLLYLLEDFAGAARTVFADAAESADLRDRFLAVSEAVARQTVRM